MTPPTIPPILAGLDPVFDVRFIFVELVGPGVALKGGDMSVFDVKMPTEAKLEVVKVDIWIQLVRPERECPCRLSRDPCSVYGSIDCASSLHYPFIEALTTP